MSEPEVMHKTRGIKSWSVPTEQCSDNNLRRTVGRSNKGLCTRTSGHRIRHDLVELPERLLFSRNVSNGVVLLCRPVVGR